jgi:hypothetical protein
MHANRKVYEKKHSDAEIFLREKRADQDPTLISRVIANPGKPL